MDPQRFDRITFDLAASRSPGGRWCAAGGGAGGGAGWPAPHRRWRGSGAMAMMMVSATPGAILSVA